MSLPEDKLVAWVCIARHQWSNGFEFAVPRHVSDAMVARGWLAPCDGSDGCEEWNAHLTEAGITVTDLNAPEFGINPIPEEIT